ncbi:MAG TPA: bacterial ammonia monooxygenase, subunit AmoB [Pseudomonadales bacterium]
MDKKIVVMLLCVISFISFSELALAHGEKAQQAGLRMRTMNWWDLEIYPKKVAINEVVTVKGKFSPSIWWPRHMSNPEDGMAYLNVGVPGPVFVRIDSRVNGVPMIRSAQFKKGETYDFEMKLKARTPGRYHVHPVISVEGTGPIIGPAYWVEVTGDPATFENKITTLTGEVIDLETHGMPQIIGWHAFWVVIGLLWMGYWLRNYPVLMPRYKEVVRLGSKANNMITFKDMVVGIVFFGGVLMAIAGSYFWTQTQYPITTPLQTGEVEVLPLPSQGDTISLKLHKARYRIPGRSFKIEMDVTNNGDSPIRLGEFMTANVRFINKEVLGKIERQDDLDLIALEGLQVEGGPVQPGETRRITLWAEDALWETMRLTSLVYDPDSRFAAMLFFFDDEGKRYHLEVGGQMMPTFS